MNKWKWEREIKSLHEVYIIADALSRNPTVYNIINTYGCPKEYKPDTICFLKILRTEVISKLSHDSCY